MLYKACNTFTKTYIYINALNKYKGLRELLDYFT